MALTIPKSLSGTPAAIKSQAESLLAQATTKAEVDRILALARSSNVRLDPAVVANKNTAIAEAAQKTQTAATAKAAADKAAADRAAADKAAAAAKAAATAPGTVPFAAKTLGMSEAEFTAAAQRLISTNPTYKNRDVAYVANMVGAKTGDPSSLIKTQDRAIKDLAIADKAAQAQGFASAQAKKEAESATANAALQKQRTTTALNEQVRSAATVDSLLGTIQTARNQGIDLDAGAVSAAGRTLASTVKTLDDVAAFNAKAQAAGITVPQEILTSIADSAVANTKSFADLQALNQRVQSMGGTIPQGTIDTAIDNISRASGAATRDSLAALQQQAQAAGFQPSASFIQQQTSAIEATERAAAEKAAAEQAAQQQAAAAQQTKINTFVSALPSPGSKEFNNRALDSSLGDLTQANGLTYAARLGNQATGEPAGWYVSSDGKAFRPIGAGADAPALDVKDLKQTYNTDFAANAMIKKGVPAEQATALIQDAVKNYGGTNNFLQALDSATYSPESYSQFKQSNIPTELLEQTRAINAQLLDPKTGNYANLTQDQLNAITQQAQAQGLPINENYVQKIQGNLNAVTQRAEQQQQFALQNTDFQKTLPAPGSNDFGRYVANGFETTGPGGYRYRAMPENKATGEPGYWVVSNDAGRSYSTLDGTNIGNAQTVAQDIGQSNNLVDRLVSVGYDATQASQLAGQGYDVGQAAFVQQQDALKQAQNEATRAQNQAMSDASARRADSRYNYEGEGFSDFDKFVMVAAIAAIAAPYVSKFFSGLGSGAANSAAVSEAAAGAAGMAEAGYGAAEIATALEASGVSSAAAQGMATQAVGVTSGAVNASSVIGAAGITPEMIAMANATLDPIAALNAAAGWTAADIGYLAAIGAPASVIAQAEATNLALGLRPDGLYELSSAETAALERNIDPDLINRFQPADAAAEAGRAGGQGSGTYYDAQGRLVIADPTAAAADVTAGMAGPAGSEAAFEAALSGAGGAVAPAVPGTTSTVFNPVTGLMETVTPGFGTSPVASVVLNAPTAAATVANAGLTAGQVAALGGIAAAAAAVSSMGAGGAAAAANAAGGGAGSVAPAAPATPATPAPTTPTQPTPIEAAPAQPAAPSTPAQPTQPTPVETVPTTPAAPAQPAVPGTGAPAGPAQPVTPTPTPGTTAGTGTTVYNPGTGLYETTIPATTPGGVAEVVLSPTPPAVPGTGTGVGGAAAGAGVAAGGALGGGAAVPTTPTTPAPVQPTQPTPPAQPTPVETPPTQPAQPTQPTTPTEPVDATEFPHGDRPPGDVTTEAAAKAAGYDPATIAKWLAAGYIVGGLINPPTITPRTYEPIGPVQFGDVGKINLPGVNPGQFMIGVPQQYQTTSPVQSKFYYGQRPLQTGTEFNPDAYRAVPAPATPWGLQQLYTPIDPLTYASQQTGTPPVYPMGLGPVAPGTPA